MTTMTRPDCAVMCNLINTHTHTHTHNVVNRLSHLLCPVLPSITHQADEGHGALVKWAFPFIIADDEAATAGLPTPRVAHTPSVCDDQTHLVDEAIRQVHLPIREGGLGLPRSFSIIVAYIDCHA